MKVIYEPHPVSPERKAELRAQGFKIIDERFKPLDAEDVTGVEADAVQAEEAETQTQTPAPVKRGRPRSKPQ